MKIAVVSTFDPTNIFEWSGCSYYLLQAMAKFTSVTMTFVGPLELNIRSILKEKFYRRILRREYLPYIDPNALMFYSKQVSVALERDKPDILLSLQALPIAYLKTEIPIVYYWDCTFQGNLEYPSFRKLPPEIIKYGQRMEQLALQNCSVAVYASEWAVRTAVETYQVDPAKLEVVPLGANLECKRTITDIARLIDARDRDTCNLIFIGVDWIRKGGDLAFAVAKQLNERGLKTVLMIVGCEPRISRPFPEYIESIGILSKAKANENKRLEHLLATSHFLIVPSIAEAFGTVFCEASSFGTPSLSRRVGGVPSAVRDGVNGRLFERNEDASAYCDFIIDNFHDYDRYKRLAMSSFEEYERRLNWNRTAERLIDISRWLVARV